MNRLLSAFAIVLLAAAGGALYHFWPMLFPPPQPRFFQGYVDGDLLQVGPEIGGRIVALAVREGDAVTLGQELIRLDDRMQRAEVEAAAAQLEEARARLRLAEAQRRRPEEIRILEAAVRQAEAALEVSRAEFVRVKRLYEQRVVPKARLDEAKGALDRDLARLEEARRQLETARLPARAEEINAAWAAVRAAEARLRAARITLHKTRVEAPASGTVQEVYFYPGEIVGPGQAVLSILPPGNLKIRFYVPEPLRARFRVGDKVRIGCDSCPADLEGRITFIAARAEYTPPVIFSPRERAKLVYRFEARPVQEPWSLAVGQPVDVWPVRTGGTPATEKE